MNALARSLLVSIFMAILAACGGGDGGNATPAPPVPPPPPPPPTGAPSVTVDADIKQLIFSWTEVTGSTHYKLLENPDGSSGFTQVGADIPAGTLTLSLPIAVHFHDFGRSLYIVQACDASGCIDSAEVNAVNVMLSTIGYFKASNTSERAFFGYSVSLSADGNRLVVGAIGEDSNATGVGGSQNDNSVGNSGAAYVFHFDGTDWAQQAFVKASNTRELPFGHILTFGGAVSLNADGSSMAVGAIGDDSNATGINGDQNDESARASGAVYVY